MLRQDKDLTRMANGYLGQQIEYSIPMSIYPAQSGVIIINAPGAGESKSGRKNRYETLGQYIQEKQIAAFITHNPPFGSMPTSKFAVAEILHKNNNS